MKEKKYSKSGLFVEAIQYNARNGTFVMDFLGLDILREPIGEEGRPVLRLFTLDETTKEEDGLTVDVAIGDYIIKGPDTGFFSLPKMIFEKNFKEVKFDDY